MLTYFSLRYMKRRPASQSMYTQANRSDVCRSFGLITYVDLTLSQATKALRDSRDIALLYFWPRHWKGVRGQRHDPTANYPRERPRTHCTGGWVGLWAGLDWCGKSRPTGIWSPDRQARGQSLYRLRYPAHLSQYMYIKFQQKARISSLYLIY